MGRVSKYPDELRERAVRMVAEVRPQYPSQWAAITAVAGMLGIGTPETATMVTAEPKPRRSAPSSASCEPHWRCSQTPNRRPD